MPKPVRLSALLRVTWRAEVVESTSAHSLVIRRPDAHAAVLAPRRRKQIVRQTHETRKQVGEHRNRRLLALMYRAYAFLVDRQVFMNALRSAPFLPDACFAHGPQTKVQHGLQGTSSTY